VECLRLRGQHGQRKGVAKGSGRGGGSQKKKARNRRKRCGEPRLKRLKRGMLKKAATLHISKSLRQRGIAGRGSKSA